MENSEIQAIEAKKRELRRYEKTLTLISRLEDKLERLESRLTSIRSPRFSDEPRGGTPVTIDDLLANKIELERRIAELKIRRDGIRAEILIAIDGLEDSRYAEVLESYFIDGMSIEDIAESEGYTPRYVYRLYSEAVRALVSNSLKGQ